MPDDSGCQTNQIPDKPDTRQTRYQTNQIPDNSGCQTNQIHQMPENSGCTRPINNIPPTMALLCNAIIGGFIIENYNTIFFQFIHMTLVYM
jgi:hypothetical protein